MNSEEMRPNQRQRVRARAAVNLCLSPHPVEQPAERRLPSLSSPPDPQRSVPSGRRQLGTKRAVPAGPHR